MERCAKLPSVRERNEKVEVDGWKGQRCELESKNVKVVQRAEEKGSEERMAERENEVRLKGKQPSSRQTCAS